MISKFFARTAIHEHADPAQRVLGASELPADSEELARLVQSDPAPEVRAAAARRCTNPTALATALAAEGDPDVRAALAPALAEALCQAPDDANAAALLAAESCPDAIRLAVALRAHDPERRRQAIAAMRAEDTLVDVALDAQQAETRICAAERVRTPGNLRRLAEAARNKDHGVARLARQRIDAIEARTEKEAAADAIISELEALADRAGPIVTALVELDRRWQALDMGADVERLARCDAARGRIQERFAREQDAQRARARFERGVRDWVATLEAPATADGISAVATALAAWREEAQRYEDSEALGLLATVEQRMADWESQRDALATAEALVVEAEQLAASTSIDNAKLPERWQALDRGIRTPALTRRFEAALTIVEQRRLEQIRAAQLEASAARQRVHALLHAAEQALVAGQLQASRAAVDEIRAHKAAAGSLPRPTTQRLGRVIQQLSELERWESFGQHNARVQLCERAEAAAQIPDPTQVAREVQKLRDEWKTLDKQHAGVPKALWERFDHACEQAYAPAARHFAEVAAQRKEARRQREEFIVAAGERATTLLAEPRDWRAIERWLREIDQGWREGKLGSVEPGVWKKLDVRLRAAVGPLRDALAAARTEAKARRQALLDEAVALGAKASDRDTPSQVKALQARWQEQAKALSLSQRDERGLWEQFRAACDAVFTARHAKRQEESGRKTEHRAGLEQLCAELERLAAASERTEQEVRRTARELQEQWRARTGRGDPALVALDARFRKAKSAVDEALAARARTREAAVWSTLAAKERLCEALDIQVRDALEPARAAAGESAPAPDPWSELPGLPPAWEQKMAARRSAAMQALADPGAAAEHVRRIENGIAQRRDTLLELEAALGLASPAELQAARLALQVQQLRDRFRSAGVATASPSDRLLAWCATPGVADPSERARIERVFSAVERLR